MTQKTNLQHRKLKETKFVSLSLKVMEAYCNFYVYASENLDKMDIILEILT